MHAALLNAYRQTSYKVASIELRIGRRSCAMDRLLSSSGAQAAILITAYNPHSRIMPPGWNQRMQMRLRQAVRRQTVLFAEGSWRGWTEAHLLVFGDVPPLLRMARRFRQNAIVVVRQRQPARLAMVRPANRRSYPSPTASDQPSEPC